MKLPITVSFAVLLLLLLLCAYTHRLRQEQVAASANFSYWKTSGIYMKDEIQRQINRNFPENLGGRELLRVLAGDNPKQINSIPNLYMPYDSKKGILYDEWGNEVFLCISAKKLVMISAGPDKTWNSESKLSTDDLSLVIALDYENGSNQ